MVNRNRQPKTGLRALSVILACGMIALVIPGAIATEDTTGDAVRVTAPDALRNVNDLLLLEEEEVADTCGTFRVPGFETWEAYGFGEEYDRVYNNGTRVSEEMLERRILEAQGESWTEVVEMANECAQAGGWCVCVAISAFTGRAVFCAACCPSGTMPFCVCDGIYLYAACGCERI